ncbi:MAG: ACP S-malonyltransferase [Acidobacteria bacterium]|nr:ACP S-malonyltransferase [Acidobacteriota bacterium]
MSKVAFLFPGQGSQRAGMGKELAARHEICRRAFEEADEALGESLSRLCFEGPEEALRLTENTQPALLATSVATYRILESCSLVPDFVAGHSLGEHSALVAAGALDFAEALRLVRKRGRYMQEAVPVGQGAMAAILGLGLGEVESLCREVSQGEVLAPANLNGPGHIVIAGTAGAVDRAIHLAKARGGRRALLLPVSAPFHCALMRPAAEKLALDLQKVRFNNLKFTLVTNVDARPIRSGEEARDALYRQTSSPVRWEESMRLLIGMGVDTVVEVGPGKVLTGMIKRMDEGVRAYQVEDQEGLEALRERFEQLRLP